MKKGLFLLFLGILLVFSVSAAQNETMIVEADIFASDNNQEAISIEVPDYIFLGNVTKGEATEKVQVYVNNTGTVNVTITPLLKNPSDDIFKNIYFQNRKTGDNSLIRKIGSYSFSIEKPSSSGKRSEYFWMWLDLTNFNGDIEEDMLNEREEIIFAAIPQI